MTRDPRWDAVVLAGGASRRWEGIDKLAVDVDGRTVLDWTLHGLVTAGANRVICAGRPRPSTVAAVQWVVEDPPGSGPVAGLRVAAAQVSTPWCWTAAGDQPLVAGAMPVLAAHAATPGVDAVVVAAGGLRQPLTALWRTAALCAAAARLADHDPVRHLYDEVNVVEVSDTGGWSMDCDRPEDLPRLITAIRAAARHTPPS